MATIRTRRRKDGSLAYLSEIRVKRDGVLIHRESKTFDRLGQARAWAATREKATGKGRAGPTTHENAGEYTAGKYSAESTDGTCPSCARWVAPRPATSAFSRKREIARMQV